MLLDVFSVVAFVIRQAEQSLFQDRILAVPEGDTEAQELVAIAEPAERILAPAIRPAARVIVGEIFPGAAVSAVVFTHGSPGAIADVGAPPLPPLAILQALVFRRRVERALHRRPALRRRVTRLTPRHSRTRNRECACRRHLLRDPISRCAGRARTWRRAPARSGA